MQVFQILHDMCHWRTPFGSIAETVGKFPPDVKFVEAPDYVNEQWAIVQEQTLANCPPDPRSQMVAVATEYVRFMMEKPHYRQTLMLKSADFDNLFHRKRGEINSCTEQIMVRVKEAYGLSDEVWRRKSLMFRSILFGSVFMFDSGEFKYSEETLNDLRYVFDREFTIP